MKGVIVLPIAEGRKELAWNVGMAQLALGSLTSATLSFKVDRDADFIAKRLYLVQWPSYGLAIDSALPMPVGSTVLLRDGGTSRGLSLVAASPASAILDAAPSKSMAAYMGLPSPFFIRANNSLIAEVQYPGAVGTPWTGDAYLISEGYRNYPDQAEEIPNRIESYAIPFDLNASQSIADPNVAASNIEGQNMVLTNNGEGKMIIKSFAFTLIDALGVDVTGPLAPCLGFQFRDSTSGQRPWVYNTNPSQRQQALVPAMIPAMAGSWLPFNMPRYLDPNGTITVTFIWSNIAPALGYVGGAATWPITAYVTFKGALLPR